MAESTRIALVLALLLAWAGPARAEAAYRVAIEIIEEGDPAQTSAMEFTAGTERKIRLAVAQGDGAESSLDFVGVVEEGGLTYELSLAVVRGDRKFRFESAGFSPWDQSSQIARVAADGTTWSVHLAAHPPAASVTDETITPVPEGRGEPRLRAVLVEPEGPARAILAVAGRSLEVEVGDLVPGDWQVAVIETDRVVLKGPGGVTRTLQLAK